MENKFIKTAVLVSGGGTNLQAVLDAELSGIIKSAKVTLVVSDNPNAYALQRAKNRGVKTSVLNVKDLKLKGFEEELINILKSESIELIVLAGFMRILSKNFTDLYAGRILNVHPSLIPSFCGEGFYGLKVHKAVLSYGVKVTGATVHFVNDIPDGGKIIMQKAVNVEKDDTPEILQKRVMEQAEWIILPNSIEKVAKNILEGNNERL